MRIWNIFSPQKSSFTPLQDNSYSHQNYKSSIRGAAPSKPNQIFHWVWGKMTQFFAWIKSWFCAQKKETKDEDESRYFKVDIDGKTIQYRIDDTENEVQLGPRIVRLEDIVFPDKEELENLGEMFIHIMDEEKIDGVTTKNFYHAWLLWNSGLSIKGEIPFSLKGNSFVQSILKKAHDTMKKDPTFIEIERKFVLSIINEALDVGDNQNQDLHRFVGRESQDLMEKCFNAQQAAKHLNALEKMLGFSIDINTLSQNEPKGSVEKLALEKLSKTNLSTLKTNKDIGDVQISLESLFSLVKKLNQEIKRNQIFPIPDVHFFKTG